MKKSSLYIFMLIIIIFVVLKSLITSNTIYFINTKDIICPCKKYDVKLPFFYINDRDNHLELIMKNITIDNSDYIKDIFNKIKMKPFKSYLYSPISYMVKINKYFFNDNILYIDFSNNFLDSNFMKQKPELVLNSIINTFCYLENIDGVVFSIDGKDIHNFVKFKENELIFTSDYKNVQIENKNIDNILYSIVDLIKNKNYFTIYNISINSKQNTFNLEFIEKINKISDYIKEFDEINVKFLNLNNNYIELDMNKIKGDKILENKQFHFKVIFKDDRYYIKI